MGKAPVGAARLAKKYDIPVVALGGSIAKDGAVCNESGIDALFSIVKGPMSLKEAMEPDTAKANLSDTAEQVYRLIQSCRKMRKGL